MKIFKNKEDLKSQIINDISISFIPTMGGLHKGHIFLIKKAKKKKNKTLVSIYVNPKQFNKKEDYKKYPRNLKKDIKILKKLKIDYLYIPTYKDIFNFKPKKKVYLHKFAKKLCGKFRKGHFEGVFSVLRISNSSRLYQNILLKIRLKLKLSAAKLFVKIMGLPALQEILN
jgi:pantoate--beta-alanine ligase